ncbi:response regulator transcription factor [Candidatus Poribacteria bacterium]|nr:response regulator transcription factor [Candidatus Poribacteria bacterium]
MEIKTIIVDDEKPAREELSFILEKIKPIKIIGTCSNSQETLKLAKKEKFDVIFLDIHMPGMNGIDLALELQEMSEHKTLIVFVTAYDEYAVKAFETNAIDYILKPFDEERLQKTVQKITKLIENKHSHDDYNEGIEETSLFNISNIIKDKLVAEKSGKVILIDINTIIFISSEDGGTYIKTFDTQYLTRYNLTQLEKKLTPLSFFRTHRSFLVNFKHVLEIIPFFNGTYMLLMNDKEHTKIPVSRIQTKKLRQIIDM